MPSQAFVRFWQTDLTRDAFLAHVTKDDLCSLRLVSHEFADIIAATLFRTTKVQFDINSFSRRHRMAALDRVGHHIKTFHFYLPHSDDTFLPPLIDPETLEEIGFQYEPQAYTSRPSSSSSNDSNSKYGPWEINDLLVRQYPPLFHAATNITTFMRAFSAMPCLRTLRISCPDQPASHRYRRDIVDYALISLRMAIEQANPRQLDTLNLDPIHPGGVYYLRPQTSLGTSPASTRVWSRIKNLSISINSFAQGSEDTTDHLKILHTYLQTFRSVERLSFAWLGERGPCPLSLASELELRASQSTTSLDCCSLSSVTSSASSESSASTPSSSSASHRPIRFRCLKTLRLENATFDATQASTFIMQHRKALHEVDFTDCHLRSGTWDDALEPLLSHVTTHHVKHRLHKSEVMDVPIVFTPTADDADRPDPLLTAFAAQSNLEAAEAGMECVVREQLWGDEIMRRNGQLALDLDFGDFGGFGRGVRALNALRRVGYKGKEMAMMGTQGFGAVKRAFKGVKIVGVGCGWH